MISKENINNLKNHRRFFFIKFIKLYPLKSIFSEKKGFYLFRLNQNVQQVFYLFEPLHPFGWSIEQTENRMKLLQDIMTCDFHSVTKKYQEIVSCNTNS